MPTIEAHRRSAGTQLFANEHNGLLAFTLDQDVFLTIPRLTTERGCGTVLAFAAGLREAKSV